VGCMDEINITLHTENFMTKETTDKTQEQSALASAQCSAAWLPIQLAPKDGTRIMLWCGDEIEIGYWSMSGWVGTPDKPGAWIIYENRSDTIELAPTHWQPLPMPPNDPKLSHGRELR
jgi:Protein of unknown function (DUF551)